MSLTGVGPQGSQQPISRDQLFQSLGPAGKDAQGMFVLWAAGIGAGPEIDKILEDPEVQQELRMTPVDAVGLSRAVEMASIGAGGKVYDALRQPFEKLLFLKALGL